jgi:DegV family protein with EDD domain
MSFNFQLSCESTVDLPYEYVTKRNISVIFYSYVIDGVEYEDNMERSIEARKKFYNLIESGNMPSTSQINEYRYEEYFEELLKKGDVFHITLGTGMTPSYKNACKAAEVLKERYPDRKLVIVDSLCSSGGYGLLVDYCADLKDQGKNMDEIKEWVESNCNKVHHQFFSTNLKYFRRSGRVSGPSAIVGSILKICPLMRLNQEGKIVAYDKVRLTKNAIKETVSTILNNIQNGNEYDGKMFIYHSESIELAKELEKCIIDVIPNMNGKIKMLNIGNIIASHCGSGTVAVSFIGNERI